MDFLKKSIFKLIWFQLEKGFAEGLDVAMDRYGQPGHEHITIAFDQLQEKVKVNLLYTCAYVLSTLVPPHQR